MRILAIICLGLASLTGQQTPPVQKGGEAQTNQRKARAVLDRMIATMGGPAYLNVQDSFVEGRYGRFHNEVMVGGAVYFRYWKWPDLERVEITKERDIVQLYLGDKEYEVTFRGPKELDPKKDDNVRLALVRRHYTMETVLRQWINEPGTILLDEGPSLAENLMAEKITIINSKNDSVSILVSPDTYLPLEKIFIIRDPLSREREEEVEIYGNWRMVQGINTPCSVQIKHSGQMARQQIISNISYNTHPPDSYFTPKLIDHAKK